MGIARVSFGISIYGVSANESVELARRAEELGFNRVTLGEHVLSPVQSQSIHHTQKRVDAQKPVVGEDVELVDPLILAGLIASRTDRIMIATGVYLLALRHPLLAARQIATLASVSRNRFSLGVASGWLKEEFDALGIAFERRGQRLDESIEILRRTLAGGPVAYSGNEFAFAAVIVTPTPLHVPLVLGGTAERALQRAARFGSGWYSPSGTPIVVSARLKDRIESIRSEIGISNEEFNYFVKLDKPDPQVISDWVGAGFTDFTIGSADIWPHPTTIPLEVKFSKLDEMAKKFDLTGQSYGR